VDVVCDPQRCVSRDRCGLSATRGPIVGKRAKGSAARGAEAGPRPGGTFVAGLLPGEWVSRPPFLGQERAT